MVFYAPVRLLNLALGWAKADWVALDLLSIPGKALGALARLGGRRGRAWGMKANALEHTYFVCRLCPLERQAQRDPQGGGVCAWNARWNAGRFDIPPDFGVRNYLVQFRGRTDLREYVGGLGPVPARAAVVQQAVVPALWAWTGSLAFWGAVAAVVAW